MQKALGQIIQALLLARLVALRTFVQGQKKGRSLDAIQRCLVPPLAEEFHSCFGPSKPKKTGGVGQE